jgi:hypothetical protein
MRDDIIYSLQPILLVADLVQSCAKSVTSNMCRRKYLFAIVSAFIGQGYINYVAQYYGLLWLLPSCEEHEVILPVAWSNLVDTTTVNTYMLS